jgi:8-oxo-dGTP pyrophosphatase MutT (NUDIX family)
MTQEEQLRLVETPFETLWTRLWGPGNDQHSLEYEQSKVKFDSLNRFALITQSMSLYTEPEWGFPKGRRSRGETDVACAIREFSEETNLPRESFVICPNLVFEETFHGTNQVLYKHVYFLAVLRKPIDLTCKFTSMQKREIRGIGWKTIPECRSLTRPHYTERETMLCTFEQTLKSFDLQDNLASQ